jgi:hypothetical protein
MARPVTAHWGHPGITAESVALDHVRQAVYGVLVAAGFLSVLFPLSALKLLRAAENPPLVRAQAPYLRVGPPETNESHKPLEGLRRSGVLRLARYV